MISHAVFNESIMMFRCKQSLGNHSVISKGYRDIQITNQSIVICLIPYDVTSKKKKKKS